MTQAEGHRAPQHSATAALALAVSAVGAGLLPGCTLGPSRDRERRPVPSPAPTPAPTPSVSPDTALLVAAADRERRLLAAYDVTIARHPALRGLLAPVVDHHRRHLMDWELRAGVAGTASAPPSSSPPSSSPPSSSPPSSSPPSSSPPSAPTSTPAGRRLPGPAVAAVAALSRQETAAARRATEDCGRARDPALAVLLAEVAGSEAQHAAVMGAAAVAQGRVSR